MSAERSEMRSETAQLRHTSRDRNATRRETYSENESQNQSRSAILNAAKRKDLHTAIYITHIVRSYTQLALQGIGGQASIFRVDRGMSKVIAPELIVAADIMEFDLRHSAAACAAAGHPSGGRALLSSSASPRALDLDDVRTLVRPR